MWRVIGISTDSLTHLEQETEKIINFLNGDFIDYFHIRKPKMTKWQLKKYLLLFPKDMRNRLTIHDHYDIAEEFGVGGININKRNADTDISLWNGRISYSCHSLQGVERCKDKADYVLLSPVFDSFSKHGHKSAFTLGELVLAQEKGIIDDKVIGMGGVDIKRFNILKMLGFGGAAMLGSLWQTE
ncbi:MAG: thiamine phosphate synthase [Bacteroidales bacterium]|jgi:thiamine-phosphate pyrophosphorylase|nr:thiamine phosphate synthase [Bacteroidales bacterium]